MGNLDKLLYWRGVGHEYVNYRGENIAVSLDNRLRLLKSMDVETESEDCIASQVFDLDVKPWQQWLAPFIMVNQGDANDIEVSLPPDLVETQFYYQLTLEDGSVIKGNFVPGLFTEVGDYNFNGVRYSRRAIRLQSLPLGYHVLKVYTSVQTIDSGESAQIAVVPATAYSPSWVDEGRRPWGIIVQLYTLRTDRNWGIGDFSDLKLLIKNASESGANMIGLNPLHALRTPVEHHCSPYSPSDRRFLNPLYIDPEIEPEYRPEEGIDNKLLALRAPAQVDYAGVDKLKTPVLRAMFLRFKEQEIKDKTQRSSAFLEYVRQAGDPLQEYCLYQASETPLDQLDAEARRVLSIEQADEIQFQGYLQWLANSQLEACQSLAKELGMDVGLMRDLAVGADGGGAEVSSNGKLFCRNAAVGAPPDPLAEMGQNWGLPPMDPTVLRDTGFEHFINLLRANMAHCGALRIDHAMGLMRLWWCPPGKTADFGAYVYYPFEQMLGLLKLESVRNQCMVIGEDMGIVPPGFRESLIEAKIFTNKMFYFEKQHDGCFTGANDYFPKSLAMLTNHDVPTIASWWKSADLELRQSLDLFEDGVSFEDVQGQRADEKQRLLEWLQHLDLLPSEDFQDLKQQPMSHALAEAILLGVSHCASQLYVIQLEDLELQDMPVNVPGTSDQYANWQRKLGTTLEVLFNRESVTTLLAKISSVRT